MPENRTISLQKVRRRARREQMSLFTRHRIRPAALNSISAEGNAMETEEALNIIRDLASGRNPENAEPLPADSLYRKPQIVKALNRGLAALAQLDRREKEKPLNNGKYWSREEDAKVCQELRQGLHFHQIAKEHNRSIGSIVARLVKLGQIIPPKGKAA